ncbi:transcriptional regulator [Coraliomargarita sinensis]|uniref:Transcriptional regulator n=1 Tax=Coraliomargarita sinensis TaxID=2174842 RepID=A0A317ZK49_9BACT|nr:metalloregulator ArsR/SmtB family transcription factor [Coraliomargarita sinensis]PXA05392.1 transcriptional regulator [Coraliomargarita sinensis]
MPASHLLKCMADPQRLRILNLLDAGPLCVCHLQEILDAPQVKISKQLAILKQAGLIAAEREGTWMIYRLREPVDGLLHANLTYLREAECEECHELKTDLKAREKLVKQLTKQPSDCPSPVCETIGCC